jgi:pyrroloquinoline quinone biosynthesis protein D
MIPLTDDSRPVLSRGVRLRQDPVTREPILLFPEGVLPLDESTRDILVLCTGKLSLNEIVRSLCNQYEGNPEVVREDVVECLSQFRQEVLVVW